MNLTDRMELDKLRGIMFDMFKRVALTPAHDRETDIFIRAMDRHQEIISLDGQEIAEEGQESLERRRGRNENCYGSSTCLCVFFR